MRIVLVVWPCQTNFWDFRINVLGFKIKYFDWVIFLHQFTLTVVFIVGDDIKFEGKTGFRWPVT